MDDPALVEPLSQPQLRVLDAIIYVSEVRGYPPTMREIMERAGLESPSTVHAHVKNLERLGHIRRDPTRPRALLVVRPESDVDLSEAMAVIRQLVALRSKPDRPIRLTSHEAIEAFKDARRLLARYDKEARP